MAQSRLKEGDPDDENSGIGPRQIQDLWGAIEPGKFADMIAVEGIPVADITELTRVRFVMKGGEVIRNDLTHNPGELKK